MILCEKCRYAKVQGYEIYCQHPCIPGRVAVNLKMRWEGNPDEFRFVTGREAAANCPWFEGRGTYPLKHAELSDD